MLGLKISKYIISEEKVGNTNYCCSNTTTIKLPWIINPQWDLFICVSFTYKPNIDMPASISHFCRLFFSLFSNLPFLAVYSIDWIIHVPLFWRSMSQQHLLFLQKLCNFCKIMMLLLECLQDLYNLLQDISEYVDNYLMILFSN